MLNHPLKGSALFFLSFWPRGWSRHRATGRASSHREEVREELLHADLRSRFLSKKTIGRVSVGPRAPQPTEKTRREDSTENDRKSAVHELVGQQKSAPGAPRRRRAEAGPIGRVVLRGRETKQRKEQRTYSLQK